MIEKRQTSLFSGAWREIWKKIIKISAIFGEKMQNSTKTLKTIGNSIFQSRKKNGDFDEKIEIRERCKGVHCVDLSESFPTSIYLQKSASIHPRTSPSKFGGKYSILFNRVLNRRASHVARSRLFPEEAADSSPGPLLLVRERTPVLFLKG